MTMEVSPNLSGGVSSVLLGTGLWQFLAAIPKTTIKETC